jgi:hypothetical protein
MGHRRYTYFHVSNLPRIHYVVWCRLPNEKGEPGETVRPALVRGSKHHPATGRSALYVSYGTAKLDTVRRNNIDLIIQNNERMNELDLPMATRFNLDYANWLPWCAEFFSPPAHSTYVIAGPLSEQEKRVLRARLQRRGIITEL